MLTRTLEQLAAQSARARAPWIRVTRIDGSLVEGTIVGLDAAILSIADPSRLEPIDIRVAEISSVQRRVAHHALDLALVGLAIVATPALMFGYANGYLSRLPFTLALCLIGAPLVLSIVFKRTGVVWGQTRWRSLYCP